MGDLNNFGGPSSPRSKEEERRRGRMREGRGSRERGGEGDRGGRGRRNMVEKEGVLEGGEGRTKKVI